MRISHAVIAAVCLPLSLFCQTKRQITNPDLRGTVDASAATSTKPFKTGTSLPLTCSAGDVFMDTTYWEVYFCPDTSWELQAKIVTTAGDPNSELPGGCNQIEEVGRIARNTTGTAADDSVFICSATGTTPAFAWRAFGGVTDGGGGGSPQIQSNGVDAGSPRSTVDFVEGSGVLQAISDTGTKIQIQTSIGPAVQTKTNDQTSSHLLCSAGSTSPLACSMSPTLTAYVDKMLVNLCVTGAITGATTLNVDTLGAKAVQTAAAGNPASGDLPIGCRIVTYYASDNAFRLPPGGGGTSSPDYSVSSGNAEIKQETTDPTAWSFYRLIAGTQEWQVGVSGNSTGGDYAKGFYIHDLTGSATMLLARSQADGGRTLFGTTTDNGVHKYQFAGSMAAGDVMFQSMRLNPGVASKPTCDSSVRGQFWQTYGSTGVKDTVDVCAKDASDVYAWRAIY